MTSGSKSQGNVNIAQSKKSEEPFAELGGSSENKEDVKEANTGNSESTLGGKKTEVDAETKDLVNQEKVSKAEAEH